MLCRRGEDGAGAPVPQRHHQGGVRRGGGGRDRRVLPQGGVRHRLQDGDQGGEEEELPGGAGEEVSSFDRAAALPGESGEVSE